MSKLDQYRAADGAVPEQMNIWHFYGDGFDSLHLETAPVPSFGPDELLVRQDAVGLCFSDTKVINLGPNHPRMLGRDLTKAPVTLGHEVSCTVVGVGENKKDSFHVGERYLVQADVFYHGQSMAYGYAIAGGLAEYSVIPHEMLDGDMGSFLLPVNPETSYAEIALVEPWACVVSAYNQKHRDGLKPGGSLLVICGEGSEKADWADTAPKASPSLIFIIGGNDTVKPALRAEFGNDVKLVFLESAEDFAALKAKYTAGLGFDDIVILGKVAEETAEAIPLAVGDYSTMNFVGVYQFSRKLSLDIGRIHYNWHNYLGVNGWVVAEGYPETRGADLLPGGMAWFIGAGGPMGQMHVQRAVMHTTPPRRIVATDIDAVRLQSVVDRLGKTAAERGIELVTINPKEMAPEAFNQKLRELTDGHGFDDVVSLVPVAALIEHAGGFIADGGWFNVFAGVARGTMANVDLNDIRGRHVRYLGSSGSALSDMQETLDKVQSGELNTNASLAAIGGMEVAQEGLKGVKEGRFPGKSLIFPLIHDLPLTSLPELKKSYPTVYALLRDGQFWTREAEEELLRLKM